ncbi:MAG: MalY/PatB family protein [Enterobacteriaceae bacterium]
MPNFAKSEFDFDTPIDRHGTWSAQWDFVADRFGRDDLLPFTISDMDFATAPCVLKAIEQRLQHGVLGYSRWQHDDFLSAVSHWYRSRFQTEIDPATIVYAPSVIYLVSQLLRLWSQPGDGVVVHTPAYDAFYKTIASQHREVLACPLQHQDNRWYCDMERLEALLARPDSRILLLCSPHNPTGKVWTREELQTMAHLCERHGVRVISDEIHMDLTWREHQHIPWSQVGTGDWAICTSGSKSFNVPALTGSYGIVSQAQTRRDYTVQLKERDGLSSPAVLALVAQIAAYQEGTPWLEALRTYLYGNLCYVARTLNEALPELNWQPPEATYLAWLDLNPLQLDGQRLQHTLIHEEKVAIMPGETYGPEGEGYLRFNVGCPRSKVEAGVSRLLRAIHKLNSGY